MNENKQNGPKKDAAKKMTSFRKSRQEQPTSELLKKALKSWPKKEEQKPNKKVALPEVEA